MQALAEQERPQGLIVVADDDGDIRALMTAMLRRNGYEVVECEDGHDAIKATLQHRPDLLLLDIGMPKFDGHAVWRVVKTLGPDAPPLIFVTGRTRPQDRIRSINLGASDYLVKPFSSAKLLARVQEVLEQHPPAPRPALA